MAMMPNAPGLFSTTHRLAELLAHLLADDADDDVGRAAGAERDIDLERLRRKFVLRHGGRGDRNAKRRCNKEGPSLHDILPFPHCPIP